MGQEIVHPDLQPIRSRGGSERTLVGPLKHSRSTEGCLKLRPRIDIGGIGIVSEMVCVALGRRSVTYHGAEDEVPDHQMVDEVSNHPLGARGGRGPLFWLNTCDQGADRIERSAKSLKLSFATRTVHEDAAYARNSLNRFGFDGGSVGPSGRPPCPLSASDCRALPAAWRRVSDPSSTSSKMRFMNLEFRFCTPSEEPADSLIRAAEDHLTKLYGAPDSQLPRLVFSPPDGGYLVAWKDGMFVAGGGFTRHDPVTAEIRRMYVVPQERSRGIARLLLTAIETAVRAAGYGRAILDTGPKQPHAEALYRSAGYTDIENFRKGRSRASFWGEKSLE